MIGANRFKQILIRWAPALGIGLSLLFVLLIHSWGLIRDQRSIRDAVLRAEFNQSRSHIERTVFRIETEMAGYDSLVEYVNSPLGGWLSENWKRVISIRPGRIYAAVLDSNQRVIRHSRVLFPETMSGIVESVDLRTNRLRDDWNDHPLEGFGSEIFIVDDLELANGDLAVDLSMPIKLKNEVVGTYHAGMDYHWLMSQIELAQQSSIRSWVVIIVSILIIVLFTSILLFRLGAYTTRLENTVERMEARRLADVSRLIVGMAHELRNPLNAVRLNLFTSEKMIRGEAMIPQDEAVAMIHESVCEVERVDELIGQLLGYARVDTSVPRWIKVDEETKSVLHFLRQVHEYHQTQVEYGNEVPHAEIRIDRKYFRQVLINLLHNAREATGVGGSIHVSARTVKQELLISVEDNGHGIPKDQYAKIFEPFYTTRDDGVGMGLAVVKSLVETAGGNITCSRSKVMGGMNFTLRFPARNTIRDPLKV